MKILEKLAKKALNQAEKEAAEINAILEATPLTDMMKLERESLEEAKKLDHQEALVYLKNQIAKREKLKALFEKQKDSCRLIERKVKLEFEICELRNILFKGDLK